MVKNQRGLLSTDRFEDSEGSDVSDGSIWFGSSRGSEGYSRIPIYFRERALFCTLDISLFYVKDRSKFTGYHLGLGFAPFFSQKRVFTPLFFLKKKSVRPLIHVKKKFSTPFLFIHKKVLHRVLKII